MYKITEHPILTIPEEDLHSSLYDEIPDYKTMSDVVKDGNSNEMVEIPWQRTLNVYY